MQLPPITRPTEQQSRDRRARHPTPPRVALLCGLLAHGYRLYSDVTKRLEKPDGDAAKASSAPASKAEQFKKVALEMSQSNAFLSSVYCFLFLVGKEVNMVLLPIAVTALFQAMTTAVRTHSPRPHEPPQRLRPPPSLRRCRR